MLIATSTALILVFNYIAASKYQNTDLQKCCEDGMKLNPMRFSCAKRVTKVAGSPKCRNAFQDCCEKATTLRKESKRRIRVGLARCKEQWHATVYRKIPFIWWQGRLKGHLMLCGWGGSFHINISVSPSMVQHPQAIHNCTLWRWKWDRITSWFEKRQESL